MDTAAPPQPAATVADPAELSPSQWANRLAAFASRGRPDTDPAMAECRRALSYWRCRRTIDRERDRLDPGHVPALADMLRHQHPAVTR